MRPLDWFADMRHFLRSLRRTPGFAAIAVLTLALGIGVTTTVVSVVDHVLLHSLPFRDAGRLVMLLERGDKGGYRPPSAPTVTDWANDPAARAAFDGVTFVRGDGAVLRTGDSEERIGVAYVAPDFFPLLGARPVIGRLLTDDDHRPDAPSVAVISYGVWQKTFGGDRQVIGRTVSIEGTPTAIVGVMPLGGTYPGFAGAWQAVSHYGHPEVLLRRGVHADSRTLARLKPGVDSARAVALMRTVDARLAAAYPEDQAHWNAAMLPVRDEVLGGIGPTLYTLTAAALVVMLLACANVANLLLARIATRERELAVRGALGASRGRIIAQLITESLMLSLAGGILGALFAVLGVGLARTLPPNKLPRVEELALDHRVFIVALGASLLTALVCGLWPAIRASRATNVELLRAAGSGGAAMRSEARLRRVLVTVQFALALVLLAGAGLLVQSFRRAMAVDVGFDPRGVVAVRLNPLPTAYSTPADLAALYDRLMQSARAVPGVSDVAFIQHLPFNAAAITTPVEVDGRPASDTASRQVFYRTVSDSYLRTMRMRLVAGRWFDASDIRSPGGSFVVSETMAKIYWPGGNAVGKRLTVHRSSQSRPDVGQPLPGTVIGVIGDVHQVSRDVAPRPEVYVPYTLEPWGWGHIVMRTRDGARAIPQLRDAIASVDPRLIEKGATGDARFTVLERSIDASLEPRKLSMSLIGAFAVCALLLAAIGMYGVVAYGVTQRTRELGVRKALGATDGMIASLVVRESLTLAAIGTAVGCLGAWGAARLIRDQLFDTPAIDPVAYSATVFLLVAIALIASWVPARRATKLDPTIAMRGE